MDCRGLRNGGREAIKKVTAVVWGGVEAGLNQGGCVCVWGEEEGVIMTHKVVEMTTLKNI